MPPIDSVLGADFDMFSGEAIRDPQRYDGMIREAGPVVYFPRYDVWATGRHEHIETMMRDWKTFSSTRPPFEETGQPMILLSDDPPDHQRVRTVISKAMAPSAMRRMQDAFEREAENTVSRLLARASGSGVVVDGHTDLAKAYVLKVFPDAIGLGDQNREMLIRFGHAQFNMFGPKNDIYAASMAEAADVFEWVAVNCKRGAVQPGGICMAMYEAADQGDVTAEEAEVLVRTLYSAGSDTTIYAIGNTLRALAEFPAQYELLRSDVAEYAKRALEEGLRYDNPARFTRRRTTVPVDVGGVPLPADAKILILHMPGGRDPRRWENPEVYDLRREVVGNHLGFGFGVHTCVGARIARMEAVCLLSALARRVARIELAGTPEVTANMAVHGHERLPLRLFPSRETP
jgi:4-methoxybenzoate monooxygenase (O-demethylating)